MMKLLIVDDEKYIRNSLKSGFDWCSLGFSEVFDAAKVLEALEIIAKNTIDVIITDIKMPKLSGIDLIKEMSQLSPHTKIIIISGYDKFEYAQIALKYGVIDYLLKPAPIEEVVDAVKKAVDMISAKMPEKYKDVLKRDFLLNLIFDRILENEIAAGIEEHGISTFNSGFLTVVFSGGEVVRSRNLADEILSSMIKLFPDTEIPLIFDDNRGHIVAFFADTYSRNDIFDACNEICININRRFSVMDFQAVIGQRGNDISEISKIYSETVKIADKFTLSGDECVVFADDINNVKVYNIVYMAKQYVEEHISENITIETITDIIHITPNYFSSIFKRVTGDGFIRYVNIRKIQRAKELLKTVDIPVSEVAEKCGFSDVKYFNRVFKKYTDMTPSEYKRKGLERR